VILGGDGEWREGVPGVVDMAFRRNLGIFLEPRSVEEMAMVWDSIVRRSVAQFAHGLSGGPFSRRYGGWGSCIRVKEGNNTLLAGSPDKYGHYCYSL
jgi:hypothetical protein